MHNVVVGFDNAAAVVTRVDAVEVLCASIYVGGSGCLVRFIIDIGIDAVVTNVPKWHRYLFEWIRHGLQEQTWNDRLVGLRRGQRAKSHFIVRRKVWKYLSVFIGGVGQHRTNSVDCGGIQRRQASGEAVEIPGGILHVVPL